MSAGPSTIAARLNAADRRGCAALVLEYERAGLTRTASVILAATKFGMSARSVWRWLEDFYDLIDRREER